MSAAPQVEDLNAIISRYTKAFAPQTAQIQSDIAANDQSGQVQQQGLEAKKVQAFGDITQQANDRGGYFSGFTPDAQAKYTAATYLPALAELQRTIAQTRSGLLGKKADLATQANTSALTTLQQEKSDYQKWQELQDQLAAEARLEAQKESFQTRQNALDRAEKAREANLSASGGPNVSGTVNSVGSYLASKVGGDGKVSPNVFAAGLRQWVAAGGDPASYQATFLNYVNMGHHKDYGV